MKYCIILFFLSISLAAFSQDTKKAAVKVSTDSLDQRKIDSLINLPPHPDSAFVSLSQLNAVVQQIQQKWDSKRDETAAIKAMQLIIDHAGEELRKKRRAQLKKQ